MNKLIFYIFAFNCFSSCSGLLQPETVSDENSSISPTPTYPKYPSSPNASTPTGNYTFDPVQNPTTYPTVNGGQFKINRILSHTVDWSGTLVGVTSEGRYIYELWSNPAQMGSTIYRIVRYNELTQDYTYCHWSGDNSYYSGLSIDNDRLYIRRNSSELKFAVFNFNICFVEKYITFSNAIDGQSYSLAYPYRYFQVKNNNFILPFNSSLNYKLKIYTSSLFMYTDYAYEQNILGERLSYKTAFLLHGTSLYSLNTCSLKNNYLCLWQMNSANNKLTYAYLPADSYNDMVPPAYGSYYYLTAGSLTTEIRYIVTQNNEVRVYTFDLSQF